MESEDLNVLEAIEPPLTEEQKAILRQERAKWIEQGHLWCLAASERFLYGSGDIVEAYSAHTIASTPAGSVPEVKSFTHGKHRYTTVSVEHGAFDNGIGNRTAWCYRVEPIANVPDPAHEREAHRDFYHGREVLTEDGARRILLGPCVHFVAERPIRAGEDGEPRGHRVRVDPESLERYVRQHEKQIKTWVAKAIPKEAPKQAPEERESETKDSGAIAQSALDF